MREHDELQTTRNPRPVSGDRISRRAMTSSLALGAGAVAFAGASRESVAATAPASMDLVDVAARCTAMGERCHAHCVEVLGTGDSSLADCLRAVSVMMSVCAAVGRMAALESPRLSEVAKVALGTCDDCRIECEKHADMHAACKACGEACATMLETMRRSPLVDTAV